MMTSVLMRKIRLMFSEQRLYATFVSLGDYGSSPIGKLFNDTSLSFDGFMNAAFNIAIMVAVTIAIIQIMYGGFLYMTTEAAGEKSQAKALFWRTGQGLLLLLATWVILQQINPQILSLRFQAAPLQNQQGQVGSATP